MWYIYKWENKQATQSDVCSLNRAYQTRVVCYPINDRQLKSQNPWTIIYTCNTDLLLLEDFNN